MHALTLISHHLCPFVQRAAIVLAEKGVAFSRINIDLANKPDWFLEISPLGKVPLLKIERGGEEDVILFESVAICEYLEDRYGDKPLYPTDLVDRARHRAWIEIGTATMTDAWGYLIASDADLGRAKLEPLRGKLALLEAVLGEGPYFAGAHFSMVDAVFAPTFRFFDALGEAAADPAFKGFSRISRWREALGRRDSVVAAVAADYPERLRERMQRDGALLAA